MSTACIRNRFLEKPIPKEKPRNWRLLRFGFKFSDMLGISGPTIYFKASQLNSFIVFSIASIDWNSLDKSLTFFLYWG